MLVKFTFLQQEKALAVAVKSFFFSSVGLAMAYANWPDVDAGSGSE